jgi:hypothetical protein
VAEAGVAEVIQPIVDGEIEKLMDSSLGGFAADGRRGQRQAGRTSFR